MTRIKIGLNAAFLELVDQIFEVDGLIGVLVGMNRDVAFVVDAEVAFAPVAHAISFEGVLDLPLIHHFHGAAWGEG